jgi:2-iminobutanoate/2-iminopropanoate deaminase
MTDRQIVATPNAPGAIGPYSQAVIAGGFVHTAGQIALDPESMEIVGEDVSAQTERVFANLGAILEAAASSFGQVVKCNVYLKSMDDFAPMNEVYARYFTGDAPPARATVEVSRLPKDVLVEIDCVALVS